MVAHGDALTTLPRLVIAAPASGHGKTTIATGVMSALARAGRTVSGHKVGPDYIDPGYHSLATGRPGRNLDPHLVGEHRLVPLLLHGAKGADLAVIEGVMGLYDGQIGGDGFASTAHVAAVTRTPVVLVVDISHASRSIAAVVAGMAAYDDRVAIVGVILNKAGSSRHADEVVRALAQLEPRIPVLGVLHRDDGIVAPSRHLGLVPAAERDEAARSLDLLTDRISQRVDLARLVELAGLAPALNAAPWSPEAAIGTSCAAVDPATRPPGAAGLPVRPVVAMAGGRAFTFQYAETEELLRAAGCDVIRFDPLTDEALPPRTSGIYLGGGFPEVHATGLTANAALRNDLRAAVASGIPTVAECAGLLYLCNAVDDAPMVGALDASATMSPRLTLSYRRVRAVAEDLLSRPGEEVTGHEFHRTTVSPTAGDQGAWQVDGAPAGFASSTLHASYLHTHWAGHPRLARRFAKAVHAATPHTGPVRRVSRRAPGPVLRHAADSGRPGDLRHHGDREVGDGMVDFAVNVYDDPRPAWLDEALRASLDALDAYPSATAAEAAIARRHGRRTDEVLATAGAAEAFTLIARASDWQRPVVVHPQFTEPDVALATAGHRPEHVVLRAADGFVLDPSKVPEDADLVVVGNPTNPTGVLHPAATIRALLRPGRVVVVDEAFLDSVPGEKHSFAGIPTPGLVVVRSLTKLWSIPGVRAGYVLAEPMIAAELRNGQTRWSVSTTAAAAMVATAGERSRAATDLRAHRIANRRAVLEQGLHNLGIPFIPSQAPFVLARPGTGVREQLRAAGYAVRRADTFPGLDGSWVRIAVRAPETTRKLLTALRMVN